MSLTLHLKLTAADPTEAAAVLRNVAEDVARGYSSSEWQKGESNGSYHIFTVDMTPPPLGTMQDSERKQILQVMADTKCNKQEASKRLGLGRQTLYNKLKKYGICDVCVEGFCRISSDRRSLKRTNPDPQ